MTEKRIIKVQPSKKQFKALQILLADNGVSFLGYGGAAGGGKTILAALWIAMMCKKYPGVKYGVFRRYITDALDTTFQSFTKALTILGLKEAQTIDILRKNPGEFDFVVRNGGKEIEFGNGSQILFRGLQDKPTDIHFTKIGGLELTGAYIDEANECPEMGILVLKKRVGRHKNIEYKIPRKVLCTFNPDKGWIYRTFYLPFKKGEELKGNMFIPALPRDNPYLSEEYLEELRTETNEVLKQRYYYGNFDYDDTPGRLFDYNAILNLWNNIPIHGEKYISGDIARKGKDQSVIGFWNGLELYKIIKEPVSNLKELSNTIRLEAQHEGVMMSNTIIDENGVGGGVIDNLYCQGFINNASPFQTAKKTLSNIRNFENLKTQCYFKLAEYVNQGKITISVQDDEFKDKLTEELDIIVEIGLDQDGKIKIIKKEDIIQKLGRSPDYADMVMMRMFYELYKYDIEEEVEQQDNRRYIGGIALEDIMDGEEQDSESTLLII